MENIIIDIKSNIKQIDGDSNTIEISTLGELFLKNNSLYIVYKESEISGMEGSKTVLKILKDTITMNRYGSTQSKMKFDKYRIMNSIYRTQYGDFNMEVKTIKLKHNIDVENLIGSIEIEYEMSLENLSDSYNKLEINIKKIINE